MSHSSHQRQRHGVRKNLVEGLGSFLVGAALVLLVRGLTQRRGAAKTAASPGGSMTQETSGDSA